MRPLFASLVLFLPAVALAPLAPLAAQPTSSNPFDELRRRLLSQIPADSEEMPEGMAAPGAGFIMERGVHASRIPALTRMKLLLEPAPDRLDLTLSRVPLAPGFSSPVGESAAQQELEPCHASVEWGDPGPRRPPSSHWWLEKSCRPEQNRGFYVPTGYIPYSMDPWAGAQEEWDNQWDLDDRVRR